MENEIKNMKKTLVLSGLMFLLGATCGIFAKSAPIELMEIMFNMTYIAFILGSIFLMLAGASKKK